MEAVCVAIVAVLYFLVATGFLLRVIGWNFVVYAASLELAIRFISLRCAGGFLSCVDHAIRNILMIIFLQSSTWPSFVISLMVLIITWYFMSWFINPLMLLAVAILRTIPSAIKCARFQSIDRLYHPPRVSQMKRQQLLASGLEAEIIRFGRERHLSGLYIHGQNFEMTQPLLFCHGNACTLYDEIPYLRHITGIVGCDILIFDYGGYGDSKCIEHRICESGIIEDAMDALRELILRTRGKLRRRSIQEAINPIQPIIYGVSLGGAVAIHTVHKFLKDCTRGHNSGENVKLPIGGLIVENTFTSVFETASYLITGMDMFKYCLYPFVVDKWNSIGKIHAMKHDHRWTKMPKLFLSGRQDKLVHPQMMRDLYEASKSGSPRSFIKTYPQGDHNNTCHQPGYFEDLARFMYRCEMGGFHSMMID